MFKTAETITEEIHANSLETFTKGIVTLSRVTVRANFVRTGATIAEGGIVTHVM